MITAAVVRRPAVDLGSGRQWQPALDPRAAAPTGTWDPPDDEWVKPAHLLGAVRRHWFLVALCVGLAVLAGGAVVARTRPIYEAATTIEIDPKQSVTPEVYRRASSSGDLATGIEVLKSWTLAAGVVDSLALRLRVVHPAAVSRQTLLANIEISREGADAETYTLLRQPGDRFGVFAGEPGRLVATVPVGTRVQADGVAFDLTPAAWEHQKLVLQVDGYESTVERVRGAIGVGRPGREASIVRVSHQDSDPVLARDVLNALTAQFMARRQAVQTAEARGVAAQLRGQIDTVSRELARAERGFRQYREREQVVDPELEGSTQVTRMAELQAQRGVLEVERRALAQLLNEVKGEATNGGGSAEAYRRLAGSPTLFRQQAVSSYLNALTDVEAQRAVLLTRRTPNDPDVVALTSRVDELSEQLRATASTYLDGLTQQIAGVDSEIGRAAQQLGAAPGREAQFTQLQRQPAVLAQTLTMLQTRLKEAQIAQGMEDPSVRVLDRAVVPRRPLRPVPARDLSLAGGLGLLLGIGAAFTRDRLDRSVRTRHDVQTAAGIPVLGVIPHLIDHRQPIARADRPASGNGGPRRVPAAGGELRRMLPSRPMTAARQAAAQTNLNQALEGYARLQVNLLASLPNAVARTLVFTSPLAGEGKTTTAVNFALALAGRGYRTLLVDADLRRGFAHALFGLSPEPGLASVLASEETLEDATRKVAVGSEFTLDVLTRGRVSPNAGVGLASATFAALIADVSRRYDRVVIDTPPLNAVADAALVSAHVDGVVIVVRAGVTSPDALAYTMEQLRQVRAPVLGAVLNDVDFRRDPAYDGTYDYYAAATH